MSAPPQVLEAAKNALTSDRLGYTHALGIMPLRDAIARSYSRRYRGVDPVDPNDVVVVTGSSAGFLLAFTALFDSGDAVAVPQTCYPCYRNILGALAVETVSLPLNEEYKITAKELRAGVASRALSGLPPLKGLIISSPGNPTGATLDKEELHELCEACEELGVRFISDEIYHGIVYDGLVGNEATALGCEVSECEQGRSSQCYFMKQIMSLLALLVAGWQAVFPRHQLDVQVPLHDRVEAGVDRAASGGDYSRRHQQARAEYVYQRPYALPAGGCRPIRRRGGR